MTLESNESAKLDVSVVEAIMMRQGAVTIRIGSVPITFDLSFPHERRYVARYITMLPYPQHDIDAALFKAFVRPGDVVLDAGANIGVTAALALEAGAARVYCVEPEASLARRLQSIPDSRIAVQQCAIGGEPGFVQLMVSSHNQGHSIAPQMRQVFPDLFTQETQTVAVKTVAGVTNGENCSLWKLDVEGVEPAVVRGALDILKSDGPRVILAEIYEPFVRETFEMLAPWYNVRRAALRRADSGLALLQPSVGNIGPEFWQISPTYVFERRPGIF